MSYFSRELLFDVFLNQNEEAMQVALSAVDVEQVERDVVAAVGQDFKPLTYTNEPIFRPENQMQEHDKALLDGLFSSIQGSKYDARRGLKVLQKLKNKYPNSPVVYNFISVAYQTLGQEKKVLFITKKTCKKFPNYIFGKIALANYYLLEGQSEQMLDALEHKLFLHQHYPDNGDDPVFHSSEIQSFYATVGRYYAKENEIACALKCYFIVKETGICDHLQILGKEIMTVEFANLTMSAMKGLIDDDMFDE